MWFRNTPNDKVGVGSRFRKGPDLYVLALVGTNGEMTLVNVNTGYYHKAPIIVNWPVWITEEEWKLMINIDDEFVLVADPVV